jgi:hypothetical protein
MAASDAASQPSFRGGKPMLKWIAGILSTVVAAVLVYWATEASKPFFESKPAPAYSVTGTWTLTQTSNLDHQAHPGSMTLTMDGQIVSGKMTTWDNTDSAVTGTFVADGLSLTRETKFKGTVQFINMKKISPDKFSGTYRNEGPEKDTGAILMHR